MVFVTLRVLSAARAFHVKGTVSGFSASKSFSMEPNLKQELMSVSALESVAYMVSGNAGLDSMSTILLKRCRFSLYRAQSLAITHSTINHACLLSLKIQLTTLSCVCRLS